MLYTNVSMAKKPPLWTKQAETLEKIVSRMDEGKSLGLFLEMGTGKTRIMVHAIEKAVEEGAKLIYVLAPLSVLHVWVRNWDDWADIPMTFIDLHETGWKGLKTAQDLASAGIPSICLCNYESAWILGTKVHQRKRKGETVRSREKDKKALSMDDLDWDIGICDESTAIKTPGSKISKFVRNKLRKKTKFRYPLTGSAYTKRPLDTYAQLKFIEPDAYPGSFLHFKSDFAIPHPHVRGAVLGYRNLDVLAQLLSRHAVLLKKTDVLDLPPATHQTRSIYLSSKSRKIYDDLTDELYAELEAMEESGMEVTATHVFAVLSRQRQITAGFVQPDDDEEGNKRDIVEIGNEKIKELISILEERDEPTIIVTQFDKEEEMICREIEKKFKFRPKVLNGSVKGAEARDKLIESGKDDLCIVIKEAVGAKGIDLRYADTTIFYSLSHNTINFDQMLSRNHRGGQTKPITYIHLLAKGTVDERIYHSLRNDMNIAQEIERNWRSFVRA